MAGTIVTERIAGIDTSDEGSGYPAEIDTNAQVRFVAPLLTNMSERSVNFLKYIGGPERFQFNNTKIEWVEDDPWTRRPTVAALSSGGDPGDVETWAMSGEAHRYPVGTIFYNEQQDEFVRVTAHVDANNLSVQRDITSTYSAGTLPLWVTTDDVFVSGFAMHENDDYVFRPTAIFNLPYNVPQVHQAGVQASFRRMEPAIYGLKGSDLDHQALNLVAEQFVAMEMTAVQQDRWSGTSAVPAMCGGIKFYTTSANGAVVDDNGAAALARSDIDGLLQTMFYNVGLDKMSRTVIVSAWAKRKISSFFSSAERLGPGIGQAAGVTVDRLNTDFGALDILLHHAVATDELIFLRQEGVQMGTHGVLGKPQIRDLPPSSVGPRIQKAFYADISLIVTGLQGFGRVHDISLTA